MLTSGMKDKLHAGEYEMSEEIFLSYARSDQEKVHILAEALAKQGYSIWWDPDIRAGTRYAKVIKNKLKNAQCVIVLWSEHSVESDWVLDEAGLAKDKLIPILIDKVDIPLGFGQIHTLDFMDWQGILPHPTFNLLLDSVVEIMGPPAAGDTVFQKLSSEERWKEQKETLTNTIGMKFALIPAGEFMMGSVEFDWSKPVHTVKIRTPFYLGIYPVTQREWKAIMGNNPSEFNGNDLPVESVSWNGVQDFIKKLNEKEGTNKYRLPTEAEWEYAARARTTTRYSFGDDDSKLGEYAWYSENSGDKTHPVGKKEANPWGLYDVHGNVWEWVQDEWHDTYNGAPVDGSVWEDGVSASRVHRGGSWISLARRCRSANRGRNGQAYRSRNLGFRLLQEV
jgi:formylglycine-generating enzyme required for sulfatase activity